MEAAPQTAAALVPGSRLTRTAAAIMLVWALGTLGLEGVEQAGAGAAILMAAATWRRARIAEDLRLFAWLTLGLAAWQLVSPLVALVAGASGGALPRASRWTQGLDTLAPLALVVVSAYGVPWRLLAIVLGVGWGLEAAVGLFQAFVQWPWERLGPFKFPVNRLHQNFGAEGGPIRRAGLGLFFHRLRFAHGAVAMLGMALAVALGRGPGRRRLLAGAAAIALLGCAYLSYARAALAAAMGVALLGLAALLPGKTRLAALAIVALAGATLAFSPTWQTRLSGAIVSLKTGERSVAFGTGWKTVQDHPVLGAGFGNYTVASKPYQSPDESPVIYTSAHNVVLTVWAETGLVGLLLYLAQQLALAVALWRRARAGSIVGAGALLSLVGFHLVGLSHFTQFHTGVALTFALLWGLGLASDAPGLPERKAA